MRKSEWKKLTSKATRVAMKYGSPRLETSIWSAEMDIPAKEFEGLQSPISWFMICQAKNPTQPKTKTKTKK